MIAAQPPGWTSYPMPVKAMAGRLSVQCLYICNFAMVVCAVFTYLQFWKGCVCSVHIFAIVQWLYLQWLMEVHPVGHMVSCHKVALPIPIHNQPFLHSDCTKMHTEKARPFLGVDYGEKYKNVQTQLFLGVSCGMYNHVHCTLYYVKTILDWDSQAPRINPYWLAKPFCGNWGH